MKNFLSLMATAVLAAFAVMACSKQPAAEEPADSIKLKESSVTLMETQTHQIEVLGAPKDARYTYKSGDTRVATVTSKGKVTARKEGETDITVTVNTYTKLVFHVKVTPKPAGVEPITGLSIGSDFSLKEGLSRTLTATIQPENATDKEAALKTLSWSSADPGVAKVSTAGEVTAVKEGSTQISASVKDSAGKEFKASVTVTVTSANVPTTQVLVTPSAVKLNVEGHNSATLNVAFLPEDHTDSPVVDWSSSDNAIATVANGVVTAKAVGHATITATIRGTQIKGSCEVNVTDAEIAAKVIDMSSTYFVYTWPDADASQEGLTLECWVNIDAGSSDNNGAQSFVGTEGVFLIREQQGKFQAVTGGGSASGWTQATETVISANAVTGEWKHVAATYAADKSFILYIDGVKAAEGVSKLEGALPLNGISGYNDGTNPNVFMIGNAYGRNRFLKGSLAFVRVWNRTLSETEIAANMFKQVPTGSGLLANWKFTEGDGNSIGDASGKGRVLAPYGDGATVTWKEGTLPAVK